MDATALNNIKEVHAWREFHLKTGFRWHLTMPTAYEKKNRNETQQRAVPVCIGSTKPEWQEPYKRTNEAK